MSKWFLLPGMGASAEMYDALRQRLSFEINFINWPEYRGEKSYPELARRIISENKIADGDVVGGSSFGGIIALEIAKQINPTAVVLIGSALRASEINSLISMLAPLARITPIQFIQTLAGKQKEFVSQMFAHSDAEFIRTMCVNLNSWSGYDGPMERVFRLHGRKDHVIPCPREGCEVIEGAGHLIAVTHADETAAFLEKVRAKVIQEQT